MRRPRWATDAFSHPTGPFIVVAQILREEMHLDVEVFVVAERSAQLNKEVSVECEA